MSFLAFQIVRASALNRIQPVEYFASQSNAGTQTITTTESDLVGASVTFTTATAALCTLSAIYDCEVTATGASLFIGRVAVDGSTITTKEAHSSGAVSQRVSVAQVLDFTLGGAGSHTVKLRALKTAAAATIQTYDLHSSFTLQVREVV